MAELLGRLPAAVSRRTVFPPPGVGRNFADYAAVGYDDRKAAADMLIDMLLLARCQALIRNRSMFSNYALVTTGGFGGNLYELESLFPGVRVGTGVRGVGFRARRAVERRMETLRRTAGDAAL
jgi:hypothetical protein